MNDKLKEQARLFKEALQERGPGAEVFTIRHIVTTQPITADELTESGVKCMVAKIHHQEEENQWGKCAKQTHYHYILDFPIEYAIRALTTKHAWLEGCCFKDKVVGRVLNPEWTPGSKRPKTITNIRALKDIYHLHALEGYLAKFEDIPIEDEVIDDSSSEISDNDEPDEVFERIKSKTANEIRRKRENYKHQHQDEFRGLSEQDQKKKITQEMECIQFFGHKWRQTTFEQYDSIKLQQKAFQQAQKVDKCWSYIKKVQAHDLKVLTRTPLNEQEKNELMNLPAFNFTNKYVLKMLHSLYMKSVRDNKCAIMWLTGVPSSGKTVMMEILSNIFGPCTGMQTKQLYDDTLAGAKPARDHARSLKIEEFQITNIKPDHWIRVCDTLKNYTTGRPQSVRVPYNKVQEIDDDQINIEWIFITTNQNMKDLIEKINSDTGVMERSCFQHFSEPIPKGARNTRQELDRIIMLYTRYYYQIWRECLRKGEEPQFPAQKISKTLFNDLTIKFTVDDVKTIFKRGSLVAEEKLNANEPEIVEEADELMDLAQLDNLCWVANNSDLGMKFPEQSS